MHMQTTKQTDGETKTKQCKLRISKQSNKLKKQTNKKLYS
jgi:hypothetical protein